ncbi:MAG: hypothetical protein J7L52_06650 [Thermotogae bacterium]|nr:hypothetical protein [Thermotogota bacterium]
MGRIKLFGMLIGKMRWKKLLTTIALTGTTPFMFVNLDKNSLEQKVMQDYLPKTTISQELKQKNLLLILLPPYFTI